MLATPVKDDLEDGMEVGQSGVAADEESTPDERTDLAQDDTQLIDTGWFRWLTHRVSVAQSAVSLKASPRNLALSVVRGSSTVSVYAAFCDKMSSTTTLRGGSGRGEQEDGPLQRTLHERDHRLLCPL
jgi:hypothetical protein